jgi:hypothetical protein
MKNGRKDRLTRRLVVSNNWKDISRLGGMHLNLLSKSLAASYVTTNISGVELQDNQQMVTMVRGLSPNLGPPTTFYVELLI